MIIKDNALEPYLIEVRDNSYNVGKMTTIKGEPKFKPETFHTSIENAVLKVATLKMASNENFMDLKTYLTSLKNIKDEILKGIEVTV